MKRFREHGRTAVCGYVPPSHPYEEGVALLIEWEIIAPMITASILIVTTGGVLVLRPIAKRLGELIEVMTRERLTGDRAQQEHLRELMETVHQRLALLEDRQEFTERLIEKPLPTPESVTLPD